jgi:hypothetical protein
VIYRPVDLPLCPRFEYGTRPRHAAVRASCSLLPSGIWTSRRRRSAHVHTMRCEPSSLAPLMTTCPDAHMLDGEGSPSSSQFTVVLTTIRECRCPTTQPSWTPTRLISSLSLDEMPPVARVPPPALLLGPRWTVVRTNSWLCNHGQLRRNTDRLARHRLAQLALASRVDHQRQAHRCHHRLAQPPKPPFATSLAMINIGESVEEIDRVVEHVRTTIGTTSERHPGGWPEQSELALIDAVFSARAVYGVAAKDGRSATGVHRVLGHWRSLRAESHFDDLAALVRHMDEAGLESLAEVNRQLVPGPDPERPSKWAAVRSVASDLVEAGYGSSREIVEAARDDRAKDLKSTFTQTKGVGSVTFDYFLVLLGVPGVKADTMIRAFVDEALHDDVPLGGGDETRVAAHQASQLLRRAAEHLGMNESDLDHAVWLHQRAARAERNDNTYPQKP